MPNGSPAAVSFATLNYTYVSDCRRLHTPGHSLLRLPVTRIPEQLDKSYLGSDFILERPLLVNCSFFLLSVRYFQ